jgi:hypothetical protein
MNKGCWMVFYHSPNPNFYKHILEDLGVEILGTFYSDLVYFPTFWYGVPRKIRQPRNEPEAVTSHWRQIQANKWDQPADRSD